MNLLKGDAEQTYNNYEIMLNERYDGSTIDENAIGLARELARMNLTLNTYTQWYWNCLLYTSPSPRDSSPSRMPSSA